MLGKTANRTIELSPRERHVLPVPTFGAFACSSTWVNSNALSTTNYGFVGQKIEESSPGSIMYAFSEIIIMNHVFDVKMFNTDFAVSECKAFSELVQPVSSDIADFEMLFRQSEPCFSPVTGTFDFSADSSLQSSDFVLSIDQESGVRYACSVGKDSKVLGADINTDTGVEMRMNNFISWNFTGKDSKPLISLILLDCHGLDFAFWSTMQDYWNVSYPIEFKPFIRHNFEARLRKGYAIYSGFKTGKTFFLTRFILDSPEEVLKCLVNPVRDILLGLGMYLRIFAGKVFVEVKLIQRSLPIFPGIY